ncbi:MAG: hypothetical protein E7520_05675 [Ruminococcaceae bacterium]|nr:hypothetical protein [Oscillospiraceae bacterium]
MPQFNTNEIDDAKKRVREMQERTKQYADAGREELNVDALKSMIDLLMPLKSKDNTPLALLALVSALKEGEDKTLILALLYILLL